MNVSLCFSQEAVADPVADTEEPDEVPPSTSEREEKEPEVSNPSQEVFVIKKITRMW